MKELREYLALKMALLSKESKENIKKTKGLFPFSSEEYTLNLLLIEGKINLDEYNEIRDNYYKRNRNLELYGLTSKVFGVWGEKHLAKLFPELIIATKKIDSNFDGEYDLLLGDIKIEVKASRGVDAKMANVSLIEKAISINSLNSSKFTMNFQQLKPRCCDVFVWIAIFKDGMKYWVIPSSYVEEIYSPQHRGNIGEGQFHIKESNIDSLKDFEVKETEIVSKIKEIAAK